MNSGFKLPKMHNVGHDCIFKIYDVMCYPFCNRSEHQAFGCVKMLAEYFCNLGPWEAKCLKKTSFLGKIRHIGSDHRPYACTKSTLRWFRMRISSRDVFPNGPPA